MAFKLFGSGHKIENKLLSAAAKEAFLYLDEDFEVNLRFVSEEKIRELNRIYRRKDEVTDVLSFNVDPVEHSGDVVVCYAQLLTDAKTTWHLSPADAACFLLVHGILHLAGYNHVKAVDRAKMEKAEAEILAKLDIQVNR